MPQLIFMNAATEQMSGKRLSALKRSLAEKTALRSIWMAHPGDIVVAPVAYHAEFLAYVSQTLAIDAGSVHFIRASACDARGGVLNDSVLLDERLIEAIELRLAGASDWNVNPCYWSAGVAQLASKLGLSSGEMGRMAAFRGVDLFNRKSHFRQIAGSLSLPLAPGEIAETLQEFKEIVKDLIDASGSVIIKSDNGAGGMGNVVLTVNDARPTAGAAKTMQWASTDSALRDLWLELNDDTCHVLVVESYHPASKMFFLEYDITGACHYECVSSGSIRLRPSPDRSAPDLEWVGLQIPADLPDPVMHEAQLHAGRLVKLISMLGYRGLLNIDAIVTEAGCLLFNEVNARWGGGSVMHRLGQTMLGSDYLANHTLTSIRGLRCSSLENLLTKLHRQELHMEPGGHGVMVLAHDPRDATAECLLLTHSRREAATLEARLRSSFEES